MLGLKACVITNQQMCAVLSLQPAVIDQACQEPLIHTYLLSTELRQHDTGGSYPQRTEQLVDHAVDMVQREDMKDHIIFCPCPCVDQPSHLWGTALPMNSAGMALVDKPLGDPDQGGRTDRALCAFLLVAPDVMVAGPSR